jgi:hypothetical protein
MWASTEWWLPVVGLEDRYLVSSWGNVWSLWSDRVMWQNLQRKSGYMTVMLWAGSRATYAERGLAAEFGVSVETISAIRTGRSWGWLTGAAA